MLAPSTLDLPGGWEARNDCSRIIDSLRQVIVLLCHTVTVQHHSWILCPGNLCCRPFGQTSMSPVPSSPLVWFSHLCYACRTEGLLLLAHAYGHGSAHDVVSKFQSSFRDSWGSGPTAQLIPNFNDLRWDPPDPAAWHGSTILNTCLSHNDKP